MAKTINVDEYGAPQDQRGPYPWRSVKLFTTN